MKREVTVAQMLFTVSSIDGEASWSVRPAETLEDKHNKVLFSGVIEEGMASELEELSEIVSEIEQEIADRCTTCNGSGMIEVEHMVRVSGEYQAYEPEMRIKHCDECNL